MRGFSQKNKNNMRYTKKTFYREYEEFLNTPYFRRVLAKAMP